jgi:hypothetical protein
LAAATVGAGERKFFCGHRAQQSVPPGRGETGALALPVHSPLGPSPDFLFLFLPAERPAPGPAPTALPASATCAHAQWAGGGRSFGAGARLLRVDQAPSLNGGDPGKVSRGWLGQSRESPAKVKSSDGIRTFQHHYN